MPSDREVRVQEILTELRRDPRALDGRFRQIHDLYLSTVRHFFFRRRLPLADCEELTQETFLGIYRGIAAFRGESRFDTWLFKVATNVYRLHVRHWNTKKRDGQEVPLSGPGDDDEIHLEDVLEDQRPRPDSELLQQERCERLRRAVEEMPDKMRRCVVMKVYQGMKSREIAAVLRVSEETVKAHLHQAKLRLRQRLEA